MRSGYFVKQPGAYRAFLPAPLPPDPPIATDPEIARLLSEADRALGRLDGIGSVLLQPRGIARMFARREAVLSCQLAGNPTNLYDLLRSELESEAGGRAMGEVMAYVEALEVGLEMLNRRPIDLTFLRQIHQRVIGSSGIQQGGGEFRRIQNWIGPEGSTLATASFVPPPVPEMHAALAELEHFLRDPASRESLPVLIQCGLVHAQFETIHPYLDGNGRMGRLLILLFLKERGALERPLLCLSAYLQSRKLEYYQVLSGVRESGDWERWLKFFLHGIAEVSQSTEETLRAVVTLRDEHRRRISDLFLGGHALKLLDLLFELPVVSVRHVQRRLQCAYVTANKLVDRLVGMELLEETTGWRRNRRFRYRPYLSLFEKPAPVEIRSAPAG